MAGKPTHPTRKRSSAWSETTNEAGSTRPEVTLRGLIRAGGLIRRLTEPQIASYGLSGAQWGVLRTLRRREHAGEPKPTVAELGTLLLVHSPSLSATLDRMARADLVEKVEDARDRRSRRVGLTARGRTLVDEAAQTHARWVAGLMSALSADEQQRLIDLVKKLSEHLSGLSERTLPTQGRTSNAARRNSGNTP